MKLVDSHERLVKVSRRSYWIYVDEYKTIWSVSVKRTGSTSCMYQDFRYTKKEFKTLTDVLTNICQYIKCDGEPYVQN